MGKSKKPQEPRETPVKSAFVKRRVSPTLFFLAVILIPAAMLVVIAFLGSDRTPPDYKPLIGRWARTDGEYMLEIRKVSADGTVDAGYFNPRPIHVATARAEQVVGSDSLKLFVELQDVNYPGSKYNLTYDPQQDALRGTYFQAVEKSEGDVSFQRVK